MRFSLVVVIVMFSLPLIVNSGVWAEQGQKAEANVIVDCLGCPELVRLPPGQFFMGSPEEEYGRGHDEGPRHEVTISRRIAVGRHEVTFAQWDLCVADKACNGYLPSDAGWGRGERPVINVSWWDTLEYVRWLSEKAGKPYRLLSEAEWEYMARAGTDTAFSAGACISTDQANYDGNVRYRKKVSSGHWLPCSTRTGAYHQKPLPVGSYRPNAFGIYDVHGNVEEWVVDCEHPDYRGVASGAQVWNDETGDCNLRGVRGGAWIDPPAALRSARRSFVNASERHYARGFRVARVLGDTER